MNKVNLLRHRKSHIFFSFNVVQDCTVVTPNDFHFEYYEFYIYYNIQILFYKHKYFDIKQDKI